MCVRACEKESDRASLKLKIIITVSCVSHQFSTSVAFRVATAGGYSETKTEINLLSYKLHSHWYDDLSSKAGLESAEPLI